MEIASALRKGLLVVPVLVGGAEYFRLGKGKENGATAATGRRSLFPVSRFTTTDPETRKPYLSVDVNGLNFE